ncbi:mannose-1-phosphate guanylyltransferase/mannose-6-phosphate isomerase [Polynucleobacter sp. Latsch14-2]|uniref:mannose-1-phosphate guanylyltransferase/mannose-6-phosphate isomerase n=1 Tax=Polynucleobacter sp. Latsch14-2 TaxID=2576920 RepID=UPI001C0E01EC|nr:mannose-1-phosphate guanylyltransferase/mannose-6-phosphate isomerase [Polynucleobacter sp. Latsch14-2]MBU3615548.1 mannose-1-phosphate guanylyltransferase/mannose-6-phosphate isomerase [Polynucleobacter sp. Latsch14-2]
MANNLVIPVILSGGSGSRLWPLSRSLRPKQFLPLTANESLFQLTLHRLKDLNPGALLEPIIVANDDHRFLVAEQCREINVRPAKLILEPVARNTAPAIAIAALAAMIDGKDPLLLILPSDHLFSNSPAFLDSVQAARADAEKGTLVTFGILPNYPETGYGYIRAESAFAGCKPLKVAEFIEKPNLEAAQQYVDSGNYAWNSGMFLFKASAFLDELKQFDASMFTACKSAWETSKIDLDFCRLGKEEFSKCPSESIDYAVMEKTQKAVVVPLDAGWNDVGAWSSVWQVQAQDAQGNAMRGDVILESTRNSYVHADHRLVTLLGVENLVVVETSDAVLVAHKDSSQDVKKIVDRLKKAERPEVESHREVFRPWGSYDSIDYGGRYQVKRITVKPGAKLSVQMHHHRAEHWVVVSGTARVRIGKSEQMVTENQSVYIPIGEVHSLENPGKVSLELIEVQSGSYLGEDDIVRFEDKYGRA